MSTTNESPLGSGAGSSLPTPVLVVAGVCTLVAVLVSASSIYLQLKNYRKPFLQRMVVRIMVMVPIYAVSSLISLFSLEAAFVIDAIRDIYEAFVIYCFFVLLLSYLGGERSLLILLHGRPPKEPVFPVSLFKREIDVSDPYTFLFLKRGILQYVQVKPILAAATLILKALGKFNEGDFRANSGYLYVSIIYNTSICLSLYCLAMFWLCVSDDLKPFRPVPKFLCVKGILFFSFWQSIVISILVAADVIVKLGPYTDAEHISLGLTDTLICIEMPIFAFAHMFAFSHTDYIDRDRCYVARMPMYHAFRDAFGLLDVMEDTKATLRGEGMDYREFEPAEGFMHQGVGRDRRIRAGLRYSQGGQRKYWLPRPTKTTQPPSRIERGVNRAITKVTGRDQGEEVHAPLFPAQANQVVHLADDLMDSDDDQEVWGSNSVQTGYDLPFGDLDDGDEELFAQSKKYLFGDYNYPCVDVSSENARTAIWNEEERVLRDERSAWFSPIRGAQRQGGPEHRSNPLWRGYGAVDSTLTGGSRSTHNTLGDHSSWENSKVIDYEQDRTPAAEPTDVTLKWTKFDNQRSRQSSQNQVPRIPRRLSSPAHSPSPRHHTENVKERRDGVFSPSPVSPSSSKGAGPSMLPPDAVDLVVEDNHAEEEERIKTRRKGEPAVRGTGLRKVYKRGFIGDVDDTHHIHGEVEVQEPNDTRRVDAGEDILDNLGMDMGRRDNDAYATSEDSGSRGHLIARATTPPSHAQLISHDYDDNPWA